MKKTLLLSVVASTMIMAGGDIAPVEPVVETPAPVAAASGWEFGGKGVVYYQTNDTIVNSGAGDFTTPALSSADLFEQDASAANAGVQLSAINADLYAGVGAGVELSGLATLGLEQDVVSSVMQNTRNINGTAQDNLHGGWISQAYLTYGIGNTSFKAGRQTLPKSLSPFAYSENWNVFHNTFDSLLVVNTDLPDTTLVGAWVFENNKNGMHADMANFPKPNGNDGVWMLTAQNKSIDALTLTGTVYYGANMGPTDDVVILWGDAAYDAGMFGVAVQGGNIDHGSTAPDTSAFGAKLTGSLMGINGMLAYTTVSDGTMFQIGGSTSALYTNTVVNQVLGGATEENADKFVVGANMDALGGNIGGVYAYTDSNVKDTGTTNEFDLVYSTNLTDSVNLTAAYVYADADLVPSDSINFVRVVGSYKF